MLRRSAILILLSLFVISISSAQNKKSKAASTPEKKTTGEKIYAHPKHMPQFKGGATAMQMYLDSVVQFPAEAKKKGISGSVLVRFVVDTAGRVKNPKIIKGLENSCDSEAIRVIRIMPRWKPAKDSVGVVNAYMNLSVHFSQEITTDSVPFNAGMEQMKNGSLQGAVSSFSEALTINPKNSKSFLFRGITYVKLKDTDKACDDFGRASELGNKQAESLIKKYCKR